MKTLIMAAVSSALIHTGAFNGLMRLSKEAPTPSNRPYMVMELPLRSERHATNVTAPKEEPKTQPDAEPTQREAVVAKAAGKPNAKARSTALPPPVGTESQGAAPTAPIDMTGLTLTDDDGSWSAPGGNGQSGPARSPRSGTGRTARRATSPQASQPPARPARPALVEAANLSKRPVAPNLNGRLQALYPRSARAAGVTGSAVVRAIVTASGATRAIRVVSETYPGFGSACQATLRGSRWSPPRDRDGRAVATRISYRCRFQVQR